MLLDDFTKQSCDVIWALFFLEVHVSYFQN